MRCHLFIINIYLVLVNHSGLRVDFRQKMELNVETVAPHNFTLLELYMHVTVEYDQVRKMRQSLICELLHTNVNVV